MSIVGRLAKRTMIKEAPKSVINPLGKRTTALGQTAIVAGVAAWGIGAGRANYQRDTLTRNAEYVGNLPSMDYDAVPNVDQATGRRDFGATGDLVFGLNNSRRG